MKYEREAKAAAQAWYLCPFDIVEWGKERRAWGKVAAAVIKEHSKRKGKK